MATGNRLTAVRGEGKGDWVKEGGGISQRTCIPDPYTWSTVWGWPEGRGAGAGWRWAKGGGNGDVSNSVRIKIKIKKQ